MEMDSLEIGGFRLTPPVINGTNATLTLLDGDTNKSYDIYFVSPLLSSNTPWNLIVALGSQGQTNFTVMVTNLYGCFQAAEGNDWDGDGVLNYMDANPISTNVGVLTITIEAPTNGSLIN
jgi:hypothetical protein